MPASRNARAMILAPRSWPSNPGFAIKTRIFLSGIWVGEFSSIPVGSRDSDFFVGAEDGAECVADLAYGGVGFYGVEQVRHKVFAAFGGVAQRVEAAVDFGLGAIGAQLGEAGGLAVRYALIDLQNVERLFFGDVVVDADHDFFFFVEFAL